MLSVIGKLPSISILLTTGLFCFFASCDSGDIHESEYIHDEGVTLSATFRLNYPELYPDDYNFTFGAFTETGNSPLVSVNLPRSDDEGNVDITLENIPEEATRIRLCFTDMGRQVKYTFFEQTIDRTSSGDIILPEKEIDLLEYYIDENLDLFDYYVITPHFPLDEPTQRRAVKALTRIPNRKLILLDRYLKSLPGNYGVAYQDFTNDVYDGLMQASKKLQKQNKLNIITEASSLYYSFIREGAERFCADHGIPCEFHQTVTPEIVRPQEVYLILNGQLDTELIDLARAAKEKKLKAGRDIGFISYNDSPINEIVLNGLTTISTDFQQMGDLAARMILDKQLRKVKCDFRMTRRSTF